MSNAREIFEGTVERLSDQGFGVVRRNGQEQLYFARGVWPGDRALFQAGEPLNSEKNRYHFADLVEIITPSPERRDIPCPHFGLGEQDCYGCPWIMVPYQRQCEVKVERLQYAMERVGLDPGVIKPLWASPGEFEYRSRAQFKCDGINIGYAGRQGQKLAPVSKCLILSPELDRLYQKLRNSLPREDWRPKGSEIWNFIDVDESTQLDQVQLNKRQAFAQAHRMQNQQMRAWLAERSQKLPIDMPVLELFAGSGNFTEVLAKRGFQNIIAVEVDQDAISIIKNQQWQNVKAVQADLYRDKARFPLQNRYADTGFLVANPPRAGLGRLTELGRSLKSLSHIAYISCQIKSFCSNAKRLTRHGFRLLEVQPVDQMPQTGHLEMLAWFEKA